jgi:hypothetical protein
MAETEIEGSDLSAIIADELRQAQTFDQSKRALALEYMRGEMRDLPARVNGSSQTDRTLASTLAWILPQTVRTFMASKQMVEFEATKEGGEQAADEASEYTNYSFFRENDGYRILYNATHDGLLMGNGAVCSYWCPEESKTKLFRNKTEEEIALLMQEEGWQGAGIAPKSGTPRYVEDPMTGETVGIPTFTVKLQKITERGQIRDMTLKPENLLLNLTATTIEGARLAAYLHDDKTRSDLMAMADEYGWDTEVIKNLPSYTAQSSNEVSISRQRLDQVSNDSAPTKSGDLIDLYECYIRVDKDGDGEAELLQVWYAGNAGQGSVLSDEEWEDDVPFTDIPCYPVPHQWQADGLYDRLADIQRVKTVLLRQGLDNTYASGMPMREVEEGSVLNPDILVNPKFNGLIWKKRGSAPIERHEVPYTADKSFTAMQMMDEETTKRTGVGRGTMALDPDILQNQTATAADNQKDAQVTQSELIARNMAEMGWTRWADKRRNLAKKYVKGPVAIPSKNGDPQPQEDGSIKPSSYRTVQPEAWGDDMACMINVGLGTGSRDRDLKMLGNVLQSQLMLADRFMAAGAAADAIDMLPKIIATMTKMAESAGLRNPEDYYPEYTDEKVAQLKQLAAQPKPNPKLEEIQATGEVQKGLKEVDAQVSMKEAEIKAQGDIVKNQAELQADLQTKEADRQNAVAIEQARQRGAFEIESMRIASAERIKAAELAQQRELELAKLSATEVEDSEPGTDGKPKKTGKKRIVDNSQAMMEQMAQIMQAIAAGQNSSIEIVRGPDGRATGARKVMN